MGLKQATKPIRIAFNMFSCAVLFCWAGVLPRETISGLFGRKAKYSKRRLCFWTFGEFLIDSLHPHEACHCYETYNYEVEMRKCLYGTEGYV